MTINGINGANTQMGQMGMNQAADSYSRNYNTTADSPCVSGHSFIGDESYVINQL